MKKDILIVDNDYIKSPNIITSENKNGKTEYVLEGIFQQFSTKTSPGRIYPKELFDRELEHYKVNIIEKDKS